MNQITYDYKEQTQRPNPEKLQHLEVREERKISQRKKSKAGQKVEGRVGESGSWEPREESMSCDKCNRQVRMSTEMHLFGLEIWWPSPSWWNCRRVGYRDRWWFLVHLLLKTSHCCCCSVTRSCLTLMTPWTGAQQAPLSSIISQNLFKFMSTESVMPSNHLILCRPLLLLSSVFPGIRFFSSESALHSRWTKYWSFSFSITPSNEYSGLVSFNINWFDLLAV